MTSGNATYVLKGAGPIEPAWMRECFQVFRERGISIRKLLLLKDGDPTRYALLEIQFVLPETPDPALLNQLETRPGHPVSLTLQALERA